MLEIVSFVLGPVETNAYLLADTGAGAAVVIDPAWDGQVIAAEATRRGWNIGQVWITHAHFDHLAGTAALVRALAPPPTVALHPHDLPLWRMQGGAPLFGMRIETPPEPTVQLSAGQKLTIGQHTAEVRCTPGHTPGHVVFYFDQEGIVFCGDVIFAGSIGRTDLPGGSYATLLASIRSQILTLPAQTRLLSGHGPETTVGEEQMTNPFL